MSVSLEADFLTERDEPAYEELLTRSSRAMVWGSLAYRNFLRQALPGAADRYLVVRSGDRLLGALPVFLHQSASIAVVNSLPYYGSHGDAVLDEGSESQAAAVEAALLRGLRELTLSISADALTLIANPLRARDDGLTSGGFLRLIDDRVGQISPIPAARSRDEAIEAVLRQCRQKTRNQARKGLRGNFIIADSEAEEDWRELHRYHAEGMVRIGGRAKDWSAFAALRRAFSGGGYRLFTARRDGAFCGALLLLCYKDWVEYFTPVASEAYRPEQVLSALIAHAMAGSALSGYRLWNWGGTWRSQTGVYHFKRGWGARDHVYGYYGAPLSTRAQGMTEAEILAACPNFYVKRFSKAAA
jgi:Acetyltransferase (GNAT) domain